MDPLRDGRLFRVHDASVLASPMPRFDPRRYGIKSSPAEVRRSNDEAADPRDNNSVGSSAGSVDPRDPLPRNGSSDNGGNGGTGAQLVMPNPVRYAAANRSGGPSPQATPTTYAFAQPAPVPYGGGPAQYIVAGGQSSSNGPMRVQLVDPYYRPASSAFASPHTVYHGGAGGSPHYASMVAPGGAGGGHFPVAVGQHVPAPAYAYVSSPAAGAEPPRARIGIPSFFTGAGTPNVGKPSPSSTATAGSATRVSSRSRSRPSSSGSGSRSSAGGSRSRAHTPPFSTFASPRPFPAASVSRSPLITSGSGIKDQFNRLFLASPAPRIIQTATEPARLPVAANTSLSTSSKARSSSRPAPRRRSSRGSEAQSSEEDEQPANEDEDEGAGRQTSRRSKRASVIASTKSTVSSMKMNRQLKKARAAAEAEAEDAMQDSDGEGSSGKSKRRRKDNAEPHQQPQEEDHRAKGKAKKKTTLKSQKARETAKRARAEKEKKKTKKKEKTKTETRKKKSAKGAATGTGSLASLSSSRSKPSSGKDTFASPPPRTHGKGREKRKTPLQLEREEMERGARSRQLVDDAAHCKTRSGRAVVRPLNFWKSERILDGAVVAGSLASLPSVSTAAGGGAQDKAATGRKPSRSLPTQAQRQSNKRRRGSTSEKHNSPSDLPLRKKARMDAAEETKTARQKSAEEKKKNKRNSKERGAQLTNKKQQSASAGAATKVQEQGDAKAAGNKNAEPKRSSRRGATATSAVENQVEEDEGESEEWTEALLKDLRTAYFETNPSARNFWTVVARRVKGKTARQCQDQFNSNFPSPMANKSRAQKTRATATVVQPGQPAASDKDKLSRQEQLLREVGHTDGGRGKGKVFRRQALRKMLQAADDMHDGDDIFPPTPVASATVPKTRSSVRLTPAPSSSSSFSLSSSSSLAPAAPLSKKTPRTRRAEQLAAMLDAESPSNTGRGGEAEDPAAGLTNADDSGADDDPGVNSESDDLSDLMFSRVDRDRVDSYIGRLKSKVFGGRRRQPKAVPVVAASAADSSSSSSSVPSAEHGDQPTRTRQLRPRAAKSRRPSQDARQDEANEGESDSSLSVAVPLTEAEKREREEERKQAQAARELELAQVREEAAAEKELGDIDEDEEEQDHYFDEAEMEQE